MGVQITKKDFMNKKLVISFIVFAAILLGSYYMYKIVTKQNGSLTSVKADFSVSANQMIIDFTADEKTASVKYFNKIIEVKGVLKQVENDRTPATFVLSDGSSTTNLRFTLDSSIKVNIPILQIGSDITMKCICTGYNSDDLGLGADILLNRSIIINPTKN